MKINLSFIPENIAPKGARSIGLYDSDGNKLRNIPLGNLAPKSTGNILYTFGALSDVHLPYSTGPEDFIRALNYFNNIEKVNFICISGDMGSSGVDSEWANFKAHVDAHSPNTPVHISAGNHDAGQSGNKSHDYPIPYTGNPLYYSFTQGDDVFIMFGMTFWGNPPFSNKSLQWLYETLEENRNKRCFVFQHMMRKGHAGDASGRYSWDGLNNTNGQVFLSLMEHYKNVLWFHGHSHCEFEQQDTLSLPNSNYDRSFGCHSIHIPSCCMTRNEDNGYDYEDSEGYVVDVYENGIHLRGRDFIAEKFLPMASYWIDNTLVEIPEKSYVDSRGVIDTGSEEVEPDESIVIDNSKFILNGRYSKANGGIVELGGVLGINIDVEPNTIYKLKYTGSITNIKTSYDTLYLLNAEGTASTVNGHSNMKSMTRGVVYNSDNTGVEVIFRTYADTTNIWFSILFKEAGQYISNVDEIANVVLTFKPCHAIILPEGSELYLNQRYSASRSAIIDANGTITVMLPLTDTSFTYTLKMENLPYLITGDDQSTLYAIDTSTLTSLGMPAGTNHFSGMSSNVLTTNADGSLVEVICTPIDGMTHLAVTLRIDGSSKILTEDDIKDIVITLKSYGMNLPEGATYEIDKRYTTTTETGISEYGGFVAVKIPISTNGSKTYEINISNLPYPTIAFNRNAIHSGDASMGVGYIGPESVTYFTSLNTTTYCSFTSGDDKKSCTITCKPATTCEYILLSFLVTELGGQFISSTGISILDGITITLESDRITLPEGATYTLNARDSYSGKVTKNEAGMIRFYIPCEANTTYKLSVENLPISIYTQNAAGNTASLFCWDANKTNVSVIQNGGSNSVRDLISAGVITVTNNYKSFSMNLTTSANAGYIALSLVISTTEDITEEDIKDIVITLEE